MRDDQFERLYEEEAQGLLGFLVYRTGDRSMAEDVLADAFEKVLRSRKRFDPRRGSGKTWLYTVALNRLRDVQRRSATERRALEQIGAGSEWEDGGGLGRVERGGDLMAALAGLSEEEREAISLRFGADLSVPEVAKVLGVKLSTAEGRVYRALEKLRDTLGE
jgi:RNA polymerase sigma-70 factor (ECF subfamily)